LLCVRKDEREKKRKGWHFNREGGTAEKRDGIEMKGAARQYEKSKKKIMLMEGFESPPTGGGGTIWVSITARQGEGQKKTKNEKRV